jgi:hypothetical protein
VQGSSGSALNGTKSGFGRSVIGLIPTGNKDNSPEGDIQNVGNLSELPSPRIPIRRIVAKLTSPARREVDDPGRRRSAAARSCGPTTSPTPARPLPRPTRLPDYCRNRLSLAITSIILTLDELTCLLMKSP